MSTAAERNVEETRTVIEMKQNPSAVLVASATVFALIAIYVLFLILIAPSPSGSWRTHNDEICSVEHNCMTGDITIRKSSGSVESGYLKGALLHMNGDGEFPPRDGAWIGDQIIWVMSGDPVLTWDRELVVERV